MVLFVEFCGYDFVTTQESGKEKGQRDQGLLKKMNVQHRARYTGTSNV